MLNCNTEQCVELALLFMEAINMFEEDKVKWTAKIKGVVYGILDSLKETAKQRPNESAMFTYAIATIRTRQE